MRRATLVAVALCSAVVGSALARAADSGPVIVVPGRNGLPVILNGVDVTGAVIEGDWGLYKPHMMNPTIIPAPVFVPRQNYQGNDIRRRFDQLGYYPAFGREPGYGRREIEPPADRRLPPPAPSFHRTWTSGSQPLPADLDPPVPLNISPEIYPGGRRGDGARPRERENRRP